MAQAGYTPIQLYLSTTASAVPSAGNLANGELAINITDGKLFYKDNGGVVQVLATKGAGTIGGSNTQVQYNSSGALAGSANLTFDGTTLTANALTVSNAVTLSGGTANGVAYLNGSKVLTTGSALAFSGSVLTVNNANSGLSLTDPTASVGVNFTWYNGGSSYSYGQLGLRDVTNSQTAYTYFAGASGYHNWFQNGTEGMRLTSTGLGIGTSSISNAKLLVSGSSAGTVGAIMSVDTAGSTSFVRMVGDSSSQNLINWQDGTALRFATSTQAYGTFNERMRLDSSGNLGIGTSSPGYKLDVNGTVNFKNDTAITIGGVLWGYRSNASATNITYTGGAGGYWQINNAADNAALLKLSDSGNLGLGVTPSAWDSAVGRAMEFKTAGNAVAGFGIGDLELFSGAYYNTGYKYSATGFAAANYQLISGAHKWYTAPSGTAGAAISFTQAMTLDASGRLGIGTTSPFGVLHATDGTSRIIIGTGGGSSGYNIYSSGGYQAFETNGQERARIDSSGNLLVGQTAVGTQNLNSFSLNASLGVQAISHISGSASGNPYMVFAYANSQIGSITQSGTTAVLYNVTSDQRLKENIADADSASALIDALQVRKYDWKSDGSHQRYGFIAQELVTVAPEAVHQPADPEEMMAVDYSKLVPMLVKEIQSLRARLAAANI